VNVLLNIIQFPKKIQPRTLASIPFTAQDGAMNSISSQTHALSINPANGETVASYPYETEAQLDAALTRSINAFRNGRNTPVAQRAELLLALASTLRENGSAPR